MLNDCITTAHLAARFPYISDLTSFITLESSSATVTCFSLEILSGIMSDNVACFLVFWLPA